MQFDPPVSSFNWTSPNWNSRGKFASNNSRISKAPDAAEQVRGGNRQVWLMYVNLGHLDDSWYKYDIYYIYKLHDMITVDIVLYYNDSYSLLRVRFGLCKYIFIFGLYKYPDMQSRSPLLRAPKGDSQTKTLWCDMGLSENVVYPSIGFSSFSLY